ncbi:hypothetical protein HZS_6061 [Henneguya salminicola]|nr:hypothetical protein HZS_6061 [Henneguya salminicola]
MHQENKFHHSLFGCCDDMSIACETCLCPCFSAGEIAETAGGIVVRNIVRMKKNISEMNEAPDKIYR